MTCAAATGPSARNTQLSCLGTTGMSWSAKTGAPAPNPSRSANHIRALRQKPVTYDLEVVRMRLSRFWLGLALVFGAIVAPQAALRWRISYRGFEFVLPAVAFGSGNDVIISNRTITGESGL